MYGDITLRRPWRIRIPDECETISSPRVSQRGFVHDDSSSEAESTNLQSLVVRNSAVTWEIVVVVSTSSKGDSKAEADIATRHRCPPITYTYSDPTKPPIWPRSEHTADRKGAENMDVDGNTYTTWGTRYASGQASKAVTSWPHWCVVKKSVEEDMANHRHKPHAICSASSCPPFPVSYSSLGGERVEKVMASD